MHAVLPIAYYNVIKAKKLVSFHALMSSIDLNLFQSIKTGHEHDMTHITLRFLGNSSGQRLRGENSIGRLYYFFSENMGI